MKNLPVITLSLLYFFLAGTGCKKTNNSFPNDYISKMGNVRDWHGTDSGVMSEQVTDSTYKNTPFSFALHDTFALQVSGSNIIVSISGHL